MTVDANCQTLKTFFDAPMRLEVRPALDPNDHLPNMIPGCKLPLNFTGNWFYPSDYTTNVSSLELTVYLLLIILCSHCSYQVRINSTHIWFRRKFDEYRYEDIYFVCRQSQESRYMMVTVTEGRW
jgi:hypothetical protein